ncbi:type II secretion system protein [bacterium]|nr:type II secretion system protein [bacterium]
MKRMNKGYTLAEILVTLGIISVIAMTTIPSIVNNSHHKTYEASADRTAVLLEEGMTEIIHRAQIPQEDTGVVQTLSPIRVRDVINGDNNSFITTNSVIFDSLGSIFGTEALGNADRTNYINNAKNANGTSVADWGTAQVYRMKKLKSYVIFLQIPAANSSRDDDGFLTEIFIDANGNKSPNRKYDRVAFPKGDIFRYQLLNNGHIVRVR